MSEELFQNKDQELAGLLVQVRMIRPLMSKLNQGGADVVLAPNSHWVAAHGAAALAGWLHRMKEIISDDKPNK